MHRIVWLALRQIEAIRESVAITLMGAIEPKGTAADGQIAEWLQSQGVTPQIFYDESHRQHVVSVLHSMEVAVTAYGFDFLRLSVAGSRGRFLGPDIGVMRSSAGWGHWPNFITSSGLIRVLGALEQFEIDVLKILLHYRPYGKERKSDLAFEEADVAVATEEPDADGRYAKPALWSWVKRAAENAIERRKLYKSVFDIDCFPPRFAGKKSSDIKSYYQTLYEGRNALAHGRTFVEVRLRDYCEAEAFVIALVLHLSTACSDGYNLGI